MELTGKVIEHFLFNSPFLEGLRVERSSCLGDLKVSSSSVKLKYLVSAYNLVENVDLPKILFLLSIMGERQTYLLRMFLD